MTKYFNNREVSGKVGVRSTRDRHTITLSSSAAASKSKVESRTEPRDKRGVIGL